ncbi:hypothetical protein P8452_60582 [Trifolium repens]|nr:hypothetical protein P8452_60582 [Trifolium repens]
MQQQQQQIIRNWDLEELEDDDPYALRVLRRGTQYSGNPPHDVVSMRVRPDQMEQTDFVWMPYQEIASPIE